MSGVVLVKEYGRETYNINIVKLRERDMFSKEPVTTEISQQLRVLLCVLVDPQ
jgi:hypothetical protein